ncbi:MAG: hypothetical protein U0353_10395 [Sandaracinus sp.]
MQSSHTALVTSLFVALASSACGGASTEAGSDSTTAAEETAQGSTAPTAPESPEPAASEPTIASSTAPQSTPTIAELRGTLAAVTPSPPRAPRAALADCPPPSDASDDALQAFSESCSIRPMAMRERDAWLVLRADSSEGGVESVFVMRTRPGEDDETVVGGALAPTLLPQVRAALRRARTSARSIVARAATTQFSLSEYPVLVELGAPLDGALLFLETTVDLAHPEHILRFVGADGTEVELGRADATLVACDGDGWTCHQGADEGDDCTADDLRAEGRLCVEPWSIDSVHVSGRELLVIGTVIVAGDGGYPSFHWASRLPE